MKIDNLLLLNFGKFENKSIEFKDGINLVYGQNESGKSTIHSFIEGMLYGFFKPYVKVKSYNDKYEKYMPWNSEKYNGILIYEKEGNRYRVERNFMKRKEQVEVYDDITGENITYLYKYNSIIKQCEVASKDFNINSTVYNNTISISQLSNKTDKNLMKEVKDSLVNLGESKSDNISVKRVVDVLNKKIDEIGTQGRKKTSPYGKLVQNIEELLVEKQKAIGVSEEVREKQTIYNESVEILSQMYAYKRRLEEEKNNYELNNFKYKYEQIINIKEEINNLNVELKKIEKCRDYKVETIDEVITNIKLLDKLKDDKITIEDQISGFRKSMCDEGNSQINNINIQKDLIAFEALENRKNYSNKSNKEEFDELNGSKHKYLKKRNLGISMLIIITLVEICIKFLAGNSLGTNVFIGYLLVVIIFCLYIIICNSKYLKIKSNIKDLNKEDKLRRSELISINEEIEYILKKYNCYEKDQLYEIRTSNNYNDILIKERNNHIDSLNMQKEKMIENITKICAINTEAGVEYKAIDDLVKLKKNIFKLEKIVSEIDNKQIILKNILGEYSIEFIEEKIKHSNSKADQLAINSIEEINNNVEKVNDDIIALNKKISKQEQEVLNLERGTRGIAEITEEIEEKTIIKDKYETELAGINLSKNIIEKISKNIHKDFAPILNSKVLNAVKNISGENISDIKITENMEIRVAKKMDNIKTVESFSSGTIDQIYFALRMSINDIITKNSDLPIILDDCFTQYDDVRLKNILKFISNEYNNRQVIIFTCHNREREILNENIIDYNYICI